MSHNARYTPFELVFGKKCSTPHVLRSEEIQPIYNITNFALELKYRLQTAHKVAQQLINSSKLRAKNIFDRQIKPLNLKIDDKIIVIDETRHEHDAVYTGPYKVVDIIGENVEILDINKNKTKIVHKNNVRKYMK